MLTGWECHLFVLVSPAPSRLRAACSGLAVAAVRREGPLSLNKAQVEGWLWARHGFSLGRGKRWKIQAFFALCHSTEWL